jgi:hypothetical protein
MAIDSSHDTLGFVFVFFRVGWVGASKTGISVACCVEQHVELWLAILATSACTFAAMMIIIAVNVLLPHRLMIFQAVYLGNSQH